MAEAQLAPLSATARFEIERLLLEGRRISEVIAHGLSRGREHGWRRPNVVAVVEEKGWRLDSDGRVERKHRTSSVLPTTALPGQAPPDPPREPVVEYPAPGTITAAPQPRPQAPRPVLAQPAAQPGQTVPAAALISAGKAHDAVAIQRAAEKAEKALDALAELLRGDQKNAKLRARLAELEAEAERVRAALGVKKPARRKVKAGLGAAPSKSTKPINHGTWGGFLAETARQIEHCDACTAVKDARMKAMQDALAAKAAAARAAQEAEST